MIVKDFFPYNLYFINNDLILLQNKKLKYTV